MGRFYIVCLFVLDTQKNHLNETLLRGKIVDSMITYSILFCRVTDVNSYSMEVFY